MQNVRLRYILYIHNVESYPPGCVFYNSEINTPYIYIATCPLFSVLFAMSDRKPQLKELALALKDLTWSEVETMALHLGMEYSKLQQIKQRNNELSECLHSVMNSWLDSDSQASWARIIAALEAIDKNVLANNIEWKYC